MPLTRRKFIIGCFAAAALVGCAHKKPRIDPKEDPRLKQPWPEEAPRPKFDCDVCVTPRFAIGDDGKILRDAKGRPLIDGLHFPPMILKGDKKPRIYEAVFKKPIRIDEIVDRYEEVFTGHIFTGETATKVRKLFKDIAQKTQAEYDRRMKEAAAAPAGKAVPEDTEYKVKPDAETYKSAMDSLKQVRKEFLELPTRRAMPLTLLRRIAGTLTS